MAGVKAPTREEILERARAMVPTLRKRALEADRNRGIPVETHQAFAAAGFYKLFQPARHGGYEMPLGMMVEVAGELGRGCGSSAWIFSNLAVQSWIIGMHQPAAQDDVWGPNPDALAASSFPLKGGTGRRVDGGLMLNGGWSFASGIDFADWENLQVFIPKEQGPPDHRFVLVPKQDFTIEDDWFVTGLSGTASKSIVLRDVFVPEHRVLDTQLITGGPSPGIFAPSASPAAPSSSSRTSCPAASPSAPSRCRTSPPSRSASPRLAPRSMPPRSCSSRTATTRCGSRLPASARHSRSARGGGGTTRSRGSCVSGRWSGSTRSLGRAGSIATASFSSPGATCTPPCRRSPWPGMSRR